MTVFVACAVLTVPFMAGMPMHSFFRPWGQLLLICVALSFSWAGSRVWACFRRNHIIVKPRSSSTVYTTMSSRGWWRRMASLFGTRGIVADIRRYRKVAIVTRP